MRKTIDATTETDAAGLTQVERISALGVMRAKAILLEQFDVHTRSVDMHGADFLIELKGRIASVKH